MPVEHKDEEKIFKAALKHAMPNERTAFLREVCGNDTELFSRVEALLGAYDRAGDFLEAPVLGPNILLDEPPVAEGPGTVIGRYKLLEKIGEGGMAVVYMAEQAEPIRRKVALKIIKLGMDTRQVIARFEAERQALALMDHPSIAKVLDAGATETGRPYFVMELVTGVSITEYCDKNNLSTKDRLALFLQVCTAVQHAHTKGIIHRDIKPSNVMVTHHDGRPVPKVIDFGIAKATNQRLTEKTLFTRYAHIIGTPAYMSPEQAELSDLDIDTRTDIYSLGVLLYELLTGTTPFSEDELRKAGYVEMQRIIREQEPLKPSTKIRTTYVAQPPSAGGPRRHSRGRLCYPRSTYEQVRGDLDWIVMKSLEKDRARRYETPNSLASDILRHLEHEPVLARGPSTGYRLHKFLRRHRSQVLAVLAVAVVAGAAVVILSMWNRDRFQLAEAEGFRHRGILSQAREQYAKADREAALATLTPILQSQHVGPEARLLHAGILVDNRRSDEATAMLESLLNEKPAIAGAAHSLLARILWESESPNAERLKEIEEHRQKAEALLPETAEAYFLRAMTAITIKEQLASLDKALQIDPGHYESRRLRAYTYYASRKCDRLQDDALGMTILRPRDPLGYSLRAIAWRELGRYQDAIADYDIALALTPKDSPAYADLSTQRSETLLRMGEYERVIAEAPVDTQDLTGVAGILPAIRGRDALDTQGSASLQYHVFCALTALGDYERASVLFRQIVSPGQEARVKFRDWCAKHVFDALEAGRSWYPARREPAGAAFLPMVEAEETYRSLSAKGHRVTTDGFGGSWSPEGKKLAFSLGVRGRSGVAVLDPATQETDLLIVPGRDPQWSPDGRYIAFVRDRQNLRLEELTTPAEGDSQQRPVADEEVWLMKSDGTYPRRLARGGWPSWSQDSRAVYYHSRLDRTLCSISIVGSEGEPKRIMACRDPYPSLSRDNQCVACLERSSLKVEDVASQGVLTEWSVPPGMWGGVAWSPAGRELSLAGRNDSDDWTGLWIYSLDANEPVRTLGGQITLGSWAPDGTKLAFCLGPPYFEIWAADLDPAIPTSQALGPTQTLDEHFREMIAFYTRRIEADPEDAYAYSGRAQHYHCLHDRVEARADMRRWSAVLGGRSPLDSPPVAPRDLRRAINLPFNCEIVFSAERPVNEIPMMSVAFGQKGRGTMKSFKIPMLAMSLVGWGLISGLDAPPAQAGFTFGEPVRFGPADIGNDVVCCLSYDGLEMYVVAYNRPGGYGGWDLWVSKRATTDSGWGPMENLGPGINFSGVDDAPCISADGLTLYFTSQNRPGGNGHYDILKTTRATKDDPWGEAVFLPPPVNWTSTGGNASSPWISADALEMYFNSVRPPGYGKWDIWVAKRATEDDPWGDPVNLGPGVSSPYYDVFPSLSPDGLLLLFADSPWGDPVRPGGYGNGDVWMARRTSLSAPWQAPVNLGPTINGPAFETHARISPDGRALYFWSDRAGGNSWQVPILLIVDFNSDGKVDHEDIVLLTSHLGEAYPLCDIGPMPWGDGVVDLSDLVVLMKYTGETDTEWTDPAFNPRRDALGVARDVVLSWTSPEFVDSHDVYFGTSLDDVSHATRDDPRGVLVSEGQTETTYDPEGLLEFGLTCYWRVDSVEIVQGSWDPRIYRGSVLKFTTETATYPIQKLTATASSFVPGMGPEKTFDRSGLDANDLHSTESEDMWWSTPETLHWIRYQFDKVYILHEMWVWNYNLPIEPSFGFGAKTVKIEYSTDGTTWTVLEGVPEFAQAPGQSGYAANTKVSFGGVSAQYVKLTITKNWGATQQAGLSEVRFYAVAAAAKP